MHSRTVSSSLFMMRSENSSFAEILEAGWRKRHTIKLSKHHLLLTPFSPELIPSSLSPSLTLSSFPSIHPFSPVNILKLFKKMFTLPLSSSSSSSSSPSSSPKETKNQAPRQRKDQRQRRRGWGRRWVCESSLSSLSLCPFFFSIQSLYSTSLPVTLLCRCFLLHC